MEEEEQKAKVSEQRGAAQFRTMCVHCARKRAKVMALEPPPPKLEGYRVSVCKKCHQPRMVAVKPAPSAAQIAAKLAKQVRVAEEARRAQESIVAAKGFMHRHSVDDKVARVVHKISSVTSADTMNKYSFIHFTLF